MARRPRRNHSPAFKAKVAVAAIKGEKTLIELAQDFDVREWAKLGGRRGRVRFRNKAGPTMDVSIFVETTFEDGETKRRNIGGLRRAPDEFGSENLGLLLNDAKTLLRRLQEAIVQDQVGEAIEARRKCYGCGNQRAIHDDRGRILDTLFGRIQVKWPRLRRCLCLSAGVAKSGPQSPLAGLFSDRATAELRRLQAGVGKSWWLVIPGLSAQRSTVINEINDLENGVRVPSIGMQAAVYRVSGVNATNSKSSQD